MASKITASALLLTLVLAPMRGADTHSITLQASPSAGGTVWALSDSGTTLTVNELNNLRGNPFATIWLSGSTNSGYRFDGWTSSNPINTLTSATQLQGVRALIYGSGTISANFSIRTYALTVYTNPSGSEYSAGVSMGGVVVATGTGFVPGDTATLVASAPADHEFVQWRNTSGAVTFPGGATTSTANPATATLGAPEGAGWVVEAEFRRVIDTSSSAITVGAAAGGYVLAAGGTVAAGSNQTFTGPAGQQLRLEAKPTSNINYAFTGWEGFSSVSSVIDVTFATTHQSVRALFQPKPLKLTVKADPAAAGTLTAQSGGVSFASNNEGGASFTGSIPYNSYTTLTANANSGAGYDFYKFETIPSAFLSNMTVSGNTAIFLHTQNALTVTAKFNQRSGLQTLTVTSGSGGSVAASGSYNIYSDTSLPPADNPVITKSMSVAAGTTERENFARDTVVRLEAVPAANHAFDGWNALESLGSSGTTTISLAGDKTVTAKFRRTGATLTMEVSPQAAFDDGARVKVNSETRSTRVSESSHTVGQNVQLEAAAEGRWMFDHWESVGTSVGNSTHYQTNAPVNTDCSVKAVFVAKPKVTIVMSPADAVGRAYVESDGRTQQEYNVNETASIYAEKTGTEWHFVNFTITTAGGTTTTVNGSPENNNTKFRHQFTVREDVTVTANFERAVRGILHLKKVTAANPASEDSLYGDQNDHNNVRGNSQVYGTLVTMKSDEQPVWFRSGGTIELGATEVLGVDGGNKWRFVRWRIQTVATGVWNEYETASFIYTIPSDADSQGLRFFACYTDERDIRAGVQLDGALLSEPQADAAGITVKYDNASLAIGGGNSISYTGPSSSRSLVTSVSGGSPAPAAPAPAPASRAAGAPRSAAAPAAAPLAAPPAAGEMIFRGWTVTGASRNEANSIASPASASTTLSVNANGTVTAFYKSKVVLNVGLKTIPDGVAGLTLGGLLSGANNTTGETLALGSGVAVSLVLGRNDDIRLTAQAEQVIGTNTYRFAGWDQDGDGVLANGERTTNLVLNPVTSQPESTVNAFYERMQELTVDVSPARSSAYGDIYLETVLVPPELLPHKDKYGYGRARTLKAEPGTGMEFVRWIVTGSATLGESNTTAVNAISMFSDCEVIAEFAPRPNDLRVQVRLNGGSGSAPPALTVDADGTTLASGGSKTYYYGNNAKITASIPPGGAYVFNRWETASGYSPVKTAPGAAGTVDPLANPGYVEMLGPQTVIAHYTGVHHLTLNVETQGGGTGGTITLDRSTSPTLPRAESGNTYTYYYNDPYGMTATPAEGYRFLRWSIDDGSGNPPSTVTTLRLSNYIRGDATITAVFAKEYTLTFEVTPRIDRIGGWLNWPAIGTTSATYTAYHGERINSIVATANNANNTGAEVDYGFTFVKWIADAGALDTSGQPVNGSASNVTSLVVAGPHTLTAQFTQAGREIKITAQIVVDEVEDTGKTSGLGIFVNGSTVPDAGAGAVLAHGDEKLYYIGDHATLDATVPPALQDTYVFMAWEEGNVATREFNPLLASRTVTAYYRTKARLTMAISPADIGTTMPSVGAHPSGGDSVRDYYVGKVITTVRTDLRPDTMDYYAFTGWTTVGGAEPQNPSSTNTSVVLDVQEKTLTANYVAGHRLEVKVKYESEGNASLPVQFTTVDGSRTAISSGDGNWVGIWQPGPQVINYSLRTIPAGDDVEIRAHTNSPYYRFLGWIQNEGDTPSGGANLMVHMDSAKTYTAVFERVRVQLKLYTIPAGVASVKAEAVTNAGLISGEGAEPKVYEVFYGHAPTLQATSTNDDYYFSRWIRGAGYIALAPGETALSNNTWSPGALTASVTEITAYFAAGGGYRTLFLFTEPEADVDIHHVRAPYAASLTYTTMTFEDGSTRPVCVAYVAVSMDNPYTIVFIQADPSATGLSGDHNSPGGETYGFFRWKPERYNFDVAAAGAYLRDAYGVETSIGHPRSLEETGGSLYYTAVYGTGGGYTLSLKMELADHEDGTPVDIDPDYRDNFWEVRAFKDPVGSIIGSTLDTYSGLPALAVNRIVRQDRVIFSGTHTETFNVDAEFQAGPYSIYEWTFERPLGTVIARVTGDSADFSMGAGAPRAAPAAAPRAAPAAAPLAAPPSGSGLGWGWDSGGWRQGIRSPAGTTYGINSGETKESEQVTAYVSLQWNKVSMTLPAFIQPETWTTTPAVSDPGDFSFLRYADTGVPTDIFYVKNISPVPAPYVKQALRAHGGTPPVLNVTSTPANYRHAGWSLDGSNTLAFTGAGFNWATWPSGWPRKVEEDIAVTPVYIRRMEATGILKVSDEAAPGFGNDFGDKVEFMHVGTLDKGTSTRSSTYDYMTVIQFVAKPDAAQHHVLERWIIEKAKADGGTTFDPADMEVIEVDSDAAEIPLNVTTDYPVRVTAGFGYTKFDFHADVAASLDGNKHGKVMIDGAPAGGDLFVTASSFYSKVHTITALPDAGYALAPHVGWTVSPSGLSAPAARFEPETTISVEAEKTATAHFERMVTLTMRLTPESMMPSLNTLTTPAVGVHQTLNGKQLVDTSIVTVAAGTDGDYDFIDWTIEDDNGTRAANGSSQTLNLLGNTTATANYNRLHEVTLSVEPAPFAEESSASMNTSTYSTASSLTVTANGTAAGTVKYRTGAVVNFTATPGVHFTFKHWEISVNGAAATTDTNPAMALTIGAPLNVKAVYEPKSYTITVNYASNDMAPPGSNPPMTTALTAVYPSGFGSDVTRNLLTEGNTITLPYGSDITLATSPATYYVFHEWTGLPAEYPAGTPINVNAVPVSFRVDGSRTVTAWFQRSHYLLETTVLPNAASGAIAVLSGTRSGNPSVHVRNEVLVLGVEDTATTVFQKWENNVIDRERTVTMNEDKSLTATFVKAVYIKINTDDDRGIVTVEGSRKREGDYYVFAEGDEVAMSANPTEHYDFNHWSFAPAKPSDASADDLAGLTFTARDSVDITAYFTAKTYSIKVTADPAAGVSAIGGTPPSHDFLASDTTSRLYGSPAMTITVTPKDEPAARYRFKNWDGNASLSSPSRVWNCDGNVIWVARMQRQARIVVNNPLDITTYPDGVLGGGTVVAAPDTYRVDVGDTFVVTPTPAVGYEFAEWRGLPGTGATEDTWGSNKLTIAIDETNAGADIVLTPCFRKQTHQVAVRQWDQLIGREVDAGSISISPASVLGDNKYLYGTAVTVKVTAVYSGYRFIGWDTDNDASHTVDVPANAAMEHTLNLTTGTTLYAVFRPVHRLTLSASPASAGTVAVVGASNASMAEAGPGLYDFDPGTAVTVRAAATGTLSFSAWAGEVSSVSSPETTVLMSKNQAVTAMFELIEYKTLTINVSPEGRGIVSASGESTPIAGTGTITRRKGTDVTLTATVTDTGNYQFAGWSGAVTDPLSSTQVTLDADKSVTANFAPARYEITARPQFAGRGAVTGSGTYGYNDTVTLSGSANQGYRFVDWITSTPGVVFASSGNSSSVSNPDSITVTGAATILARFESDGTEGVLANVTGGTIVSRVQDHSPGGGDYIEEITFRPDAHHSLTTMDGDISNYEELSGGDIRCWVYVNKGGGYKEVTIVFTLTGYSIATECIPAGAGDIQVVFVPGSGLSFERDGVIMYTADSELRFIANEKTDGDHVFDKWVFDTAEIVDAGNPKSVTVRMKNNLLARVYFKPKPVPRSVTLEMNFVGSRTFNNATIKLGDDSTVWSSGIRSITGAFWDGDSVHAEGILHDTGGKAAGFNVDGWTGLGSAGTATNSLDGTSSEAVFTVTEDMTIAVNFKEVVPTLQTWTAATRADDDMKSIISAGGEITAGGMYEFYDEIMLWLQINPEYILRPSTGSADGWRLSDLGQRIGDIESAFMPFTPDPAKLGAPFVPDSTKPNKIAYPDPENPGEFRTPDPENPGEYKAMVDNDRHANFRKYAQDMDGNYIVPGTNRTLIIKWTDPEGTEPDKDEQSTWQQYGKRVRLTSEVTTVAPDLANKAEMWAKGVYFLETDSPAKLDSTSDKSGNLLIRPGGD